jgi:hypothetical protein
MTKRASAELKAAIRRYHRDGWSYYALAKIVPYTGEAIAKWCDPGLRSRQVKSGADWAARNPGKHRAATERWSQANKDHIKAKRKERYAREKAANPSLNKDHHARNREKRNAESRAYRAANPEKMRQLDRNYRQNNPDKNAAKTAKARADRAQATPPWLTRDHLEEIESFYSTAKALEQAFGGKYDVDHIHPINGRTCCGLHAPWNLQVLPASENRQKSNKLT